MIGAEGMDLQGFRGLFAGDVLLYGMRGSVRAARGNGSVPFAELPTAFSTGL